MMQERFLTEQMTDKVISFRQLQQKERVRSKSFRDYRKKHMGRHGLTVVEYDELTDVYTRQTFLEYASTLMQIMPEKRFHLIVSNVSNFKMINAVYGEMVGDMVLRYLADCYKKWWNDGIIARNGNDQFLCLIYGDEGLDHAQLREIVGEISENAPVEKLKNKYGVYEDIDKTASVSEICDCAFLAVKSISDQYGEEIAYFKEEMRQQQVRERMMEDEFEEALSRREFLVYYQPKVNADTETVIGAEALVRWQRPDGSIIPPAEFIPVYEKDGLIETLDEYVFRQVCRYQKKRMEQQMEVLPISVNLSRRSIQNPDLAEHYTQIVKEYKIPFSCVPIEVTESAAVYSQSICEGANELVKNGFLLHVDDFGSGYSSLLSLSNLPFSVMKLDKKLIDGLQQEKGRAVVEQAILLAQILHMDVIAEGVENREQVDVLKKLNCHKIQGYYYASPMAEDAFEQYLEKN